MQQRSSGGCWRTLHGLADFAIVQSYLSTAAKWDISKLDALRALFNGNPLATSPPSNPASSQPATSAPHNKPLTLGE